MPHRRLLENNRRWVAQTKANDPDFFKRLASTHEPKFLFIGCSDARVPADVITQTLPGEMFVHRNIANQVVATDQNLLAVLQYAVDVLKVQDVIVCGHGECGGVKASMTPPGHVPPLVDNWLQNIRTVGRLHAEELEAITEPQERYERLIELNVMEQVYNLSRTPVVQEAWARGATLRLHGFVYKLTEGLLRDLHVTFDGDAPHDDTDRAAASASANGAAPRTDREVEIGVR